MNLLFYQTTHNAPGEHLRNVINTLVPEGQAEICTTIDGLSHRLRRLNDHVDIAVLLAASRKDLADILSLGDLLRDVRIILILPDRDKETISKGHALYPRYLSYADSDFKDVAAVLEKMIKRAGSINY